MIDHQLRLAFRQSGHTALSPHAARQLSLNQALLPELYRSELLFRATVGPHPALLEVQSARQEARILAKSFRLSRDNKDATALFGPMPAGLTPSQQRAWAMVCTQRICAITGAAGTGKTTLVSRLISGWEESKRSCALLCPTGKGAEVLSSKCGTDAKTAHRWLGLIPGQGPQKNRWEPADEELIVLDESTMADSELLDMILDAIPATSRVLLVGDVNQLNPVGPGQPFADLLELGVVPFVELTEVKRQEEGSGILYLAHSLLGRVPKKIKADRHIGLLAGADIERAAADWWMELGNMDRVILSAYRDEKMRTSTSSVNESILKRHRRGASIGNSGACRGDWIICEKNNYVYRTFNGQVFRVALDQIYRGEILLLDSKNEEVRVRDLSDFSPAPAMTVHKAQGSEFPEVCLLLDGKYRYSRNIVYTAVTRARDKLLLAGSWQVLMRDLPTERRLTAMQWLAQDPELLDRVLRIEAKVAEVIKDAMKHGLED